jgi:sulfhydrogenase subunit beta (sulfur reductase)
MEAVFISKLKPLLDALAARMEVYIPVRKTNHFVFVKYDSASSAPIELNEIRACTPVKEFLFPLREVAAMFPGPESAAEVKPFAVFGLKDCDIRSIFILDKVFAEDEFKDPLYISRREKMFIVSSDCLQAGESCFCGLFDGKGFPDKGFDLNVSPISEGFVVDIGSRKGHNFVEQNAGLFADLPGTLLAERNQNRIKLRKQLEQRSAEINLADALPQIIESSDNSELFDEQARLCIECQACTRVCPTCHCFYLYDTKQKDYFAKMKIWDSCMRIGYAAVAGGANPNKVLGERLKHRLMHKFVYFLERYGINMCVGCGRCVDADAGGIDLRQVLKRLSEEYRGQGTKKTKSSK